LISPAGLERLWSITAIMAAQTGDAPLVPPTANQPRRPSQLELTPAVQ
jgi:hypothetical protein